MTFVIAPFLFKEKNMEVLSANNIGIKFGQRWLYKDVNFELNTGEILTILGDNGVGKTTIVQAMLKKIPTTIGEFDWKIDRQEDVCYIPQYRPNMQDFPLSIKSFVALSFDASIRPWLNKTEKKKLSEVLKLTNLQDIVDQRIDQASGGERQRAYLAQALINSPKLLILDEATANLDNIAKFQLMDLISELKQNQNLSIVMISHDLNIVKKYTDKYLYLKPGSGEFNTVNLLDVSKLEIAGEHHV